MEQEELWKTVETMPLFDNHCHTTLKHASRSMPLASVFTEGPKKELTVATMRNMRHLMEQFNSPTADSVLPRSGMNAGEFLRRGVCFSSCEWKEE